MTDTYSLTLTATTRNGIELKQLRLDNALSKQSLDLQAEPLFNELRTLYPNGYVFRKYETNRVNKTI